MQPRVRGLVGVVVILLLVMFAPTASGQEKFLRWHRWDSNIWVMADGTFKVEEQFEIEFVTGEFRFGFRDIPISRFEAIRDVRVREGAVEYAEARSEAPNTYYWLNDGSEYVINWFYPPTTNQTRVFTLEYVVEGGLFISSEYEDRLFWKVVGGDHAFPVESSTVTVHLPPDAQVDTSTAEPAALGPNGWFEIAGDRTYVTFGASDIPPEVEFEVGVYFPHGFVTADPPSWQDAYVREQSWNEVQRPVFNVLLGAVGLLLLVIGPLAVYALWLIGGRDPAVGAVASYRTDPPSELPPGLAGTLVDEKADLQDILATVVDLARRGVIEMEEQERKVFGMVAGKEFSFRKKGELSGLRSFERTLVRKMFGSKDEIELEDLRERFYAYIPELQKQLYDEAVREGYFPASPKAVRGRYLALGIAGLVLSVGVGFCVAGAFSSRIDAILCPFAGLGVSSIVLIAVSNVMPAKTRKGAEEAAQWNAFRTYLRKIEDFSALESVTEQFDRFLPFAIAFGLEHGWINKFSRVPDTPVPNWYFPMGRAYGGGRGSAGGLGGAGRGEGGEAGRDLRDQAAQPGGSLDGMADGMFRGLSGMSSGLFSMLNSASSAFTSVPHSSGSLGGGFSGGFSGGGGGGGGGAGFG